VSHQQSACSVINLNECDSTQSRLTKRDTIQIHELCSSTDSIQIEVIMKCSSTKILMQIFYELVSFILLQYYWSVTTGLYGKFNFIIYLCIPISSMTFSYSSSSVLILQHLALILSLFLFLILGNLVGVSKYHICI
jgi:hypothetical protein